MFLIRENCALRRIHHRVIKHMTSEYCWEIFQNVLTETEISQRRTMVPRHAECFELKGIGRASEAGLSDLLLTSCLTPHFCPLKWVTETTVPLPQGCACELEVLSPKPAMQPRAATFSPSPWDPHSRGAFPQTREKWCYKERPRRISKTNSNNNKNQMKNQALMNLPS